MCSVICVTNRALCQGSFFGQLEKIAETHPDLIILREKDMDENDFAELAKQVKEICGRYDVKLSINSFWRTAASLGIRYVHLPLSILREMNEQDKAAFEVIGVSCHSVEEAREAVCLGANYIIAGHVFATDCKKGLAGRGLEFLREVCEGVSVPVYAIGGISADNASLVVEAGADGVCIMSGFMKAENVSEYMDSIRGELYE